MSGPATTYREHLEARRKEESHWAVRDRLLASVRLAVFLAFLVSGWFSLVPAVPISGFYPLSAFALFVVLVLVHDQVIGRRRQAARGAAWYEWGLARLEERWPGLGVTGEGYRQAGHPYAADLDLFGSGSLFELLCTARSQAGESCLAGWLQEPAAAEVVAQRQEAVAELRSALALREELFRLAGEVREGVHPERLVRWGEAASRLPAPWLRWLAPALVGVTGVAGFGWLVFEWSAWGLVPALALQGLYGLALRSRVAGMGKGVGACLRELAVVGRMLARLEREQVAAPLLRELAQVIGSGGRSPARLIAGLARRQELLEARLNQLFAVVSPLLLWGTQWAFAIEAWRVAHGPRLGAWLRAAGEMEALLALAGYSYEHPEDPLPEVAAEGSFVRAEGLGHPLLPADRCVRNDVLVSEAQPLLIVSGSNMSGKSTLLRALGTNVVLARCGGPVRATAMALGPLLPACSIQVLDSLQDGRSRFYAEIQRLKVVVDQSHQGPVLFLLDEILHGTNSHDRRVGTEAVLRTLHAAGSVGLVTTHDLALSSIAERVPGACNVHFSDRVEGGEMVFDYQMRPGIVQRSNALALMRSVGLDVGEEPVG